MDFCLQVLTAPVVVSHLNNNAWICEKWFSEGSLFLSFLHLLDKNSVSL